MRWNLLVISICRSCFLLSPLWSSYMKIVNGFGTFPLSSHQQKQHTQRRSIVFASEKSSSSDFKNTPTISPQKYPKQQQQEEQHHHQQQQEEQQQQYKSMEYNTKPATAVLTSNESNKFHTTTTTKGNDRQQRKRQRRQQRRSVDSGLSKYFRSLSRITTNQRQRFVTGRYPLTVSLEENPTKRWLDNNHNNNNNNNDNRLGFNTCHTQLYINGTLLEKSLARYDRFQWHQQDEEDEDEDDDDMIWGMEYIGEIHTSRPAYLSILSTLGAGQMATRVNGNYNWISPWKSSTTTKTKTTTPQSSDNYLSLTNTQNNNNNNNNNNDNNINNNDNTMDGDRLWITSFSITKTLGQLNYVNIQNGQMGQTNSRTNRMIRWPNEVSSSVVNKDKEEEDVLLISDGFLVPGKQRGNVYVVKYPGHRDLEWTIQLSPSSSSSSASRNEETKDNDDDDDDDWFYHRAIWIDLTGDGRQSILTSRAKRPSMLKQSSQSSQSSSSKTTTTTVGQLVWLERPKPYGYDAITKTPLDIDGTVFDPFSSRNTPWKLRVLNEGPDVMFCVSDLDPTDNTIEVIASEFFSRQISLHSIQIGSSSSSSLPKVVFSRILDNTCGSSFGCILANLDDNKNNNNGESLLHPKVVDCGSTVPTLQKGDCVSHILVTSHECRYSNDHHHHHSSSSSMMDSSSLSLSSSSYSDHNNNNDDDNDDSTMDGGCLFAYKIPTLWKTEPWIRTIVATGFHVKRQLGNVINPGAPGFCYTFYPKVDMNNDDDDDDGGRRQGRPLIAIAGDCAESAYIYRPTTTTRRRRNDDNNEDDQDHHYYYHSMKDKNNEKIQMNHDEDRDHNDDMMMIHSNNNEINNGHTTTTNNPPPYYDQSTQYKLMCEIQCDATVGSLAIGYHDFCNVEQQSGYAKLYIPCYEKDKILVFALENGFGDDNDDDIDIDDDDGW